MKTCLRFLVVPLLFLFSLAAPDALHAQSAKIFVASFGNDANAGTSVSPKRNFQAAHDAVAAGGEIVVLDTSGYGPVTITKGLSITVPPGVNGFVTVAGGASGIIINAAATDVVTLRGLIVETNANGIGIAIGSGGTVSVEDCTVRGFNTGVSAGETAPVHLSMRGCTVRDGAFGIILLRGDAVLTGCTVDNANETAVYGDSSDSGSPTRLVAVNCNLTHSGSALYAYTSMAVMVADNCTISGNSTGLVAASNGQLLSRGNNTFFNNTTDGTFTSTLAAK